MTATTAAQAPFVKIQKFEDMLDLEFDGQTVRASSETQLAGVPLYRMEQMRISDQRDKEAAKAAKAALYAAVDALTPEEFAAYGAYRARVLADLKAAA